MEKRGFTDCLLSQRSAVIVQKRDAMPNFPVTIGSIVRIEIYRVNLKPEGTESYLEPKSRGKLLYRDNSIIKLLFVMLNRYVACQSRAFTNASRDYSRGAGAIL